MSQSTEFATALREKRPRQLFAKKREINKLRKDIRECQQQGGCDNQTSKDSIEAKTKPHVVSQHPAAEIFKDPKRRPKLTDRAQKLQSDGSWKANLLRPSRKRRKRLVTGSRGQNRKTATYSDPRSQFLEDDDDDDYFPSINELWDKTERQRDQHQISTPASGTTRSGSRHETQPA